MKMILYSRKKIAFLLCTLIALGFFYCISRDAKQARPMHFDQAHAEFEQRKQALIDYYCSPTYMQDAEQVCAQAQLYFSQVPVKHNSLVIFDIDDTALIHIQTRDKFNFVWNKLPHLVQAQQDDIDPALQPVLRLYKMLVHQGFNIVFMTGRRHDIEEKTIKNLALHGFDTYEKLILFPQELVDKVSIGAWKASERKKLAQTYEIVGNVGDRPIDFEDGNNGYIVKLPNYLY